MTMEAIEIKAQPSGSTTKLNDRLYTEIPCVSALLDAVSLFEVSGSKWMLGLPYEHFDKQIHEHCFDEVRHTQMVTEAARRLRSTMSDEDLLKEARLNQKFYKATERYIQRLTMRLLKKVMAAGIGNKEFSHSGYSLLGMAIEKRIMKIYPRLGSLCPVDHISELAKQIVKDERKHLHFVGDKIDTGYTTGDITQSEVLKIEEAVAQLWQKELNEAMANA